MSWIFTLQETCCHMPIGSIACLESGFFFPVPGWLSNFLFFMTLYPLILHTTCNFPYLAHSHPEDGDIFKKLNSVALVRE
jgi:hypothetical protein